MRNPRMYRSKKLYELACRTIKGLPLPQRPLTKLLLASILARLLRSQDTIVSNFVWMSNHPHMFLYSLDAEALRDFHGQCKKRITDFLKRLLNIKDNLSLWNVNDSMPEMLDLDQATERLIYMFLNPVRGKNSKCRTIDNYKGFNTWNEFISVPADVNACVEKEIPHILLTDIEALSRANPSKAEEERVIEELKNKSKKRETQILRVYPLKWLEVYGITEPKDIERIRNKVISRVREVEADLAEGRKEEEPKLEGYDITDSYIPPKQERRVFMYGSTKEIRLRYLELFKRFKEKCRACYEQMKQGCKDILWPPEAFVPPAPKLCNVF